MKFDFWFDLPKALINIALPILTKEELDFCRVLNKSTEDINRIYAVFNNDFEGNLNNLQSEELEKIRQKLFLIQKEKIDLLCKSIKFSTKVMSKILQYVENYESLNVPDAEMLTKVKLFLKITRMVMDNSKISLNESKADRERDFFTMIMVFSEKIQSKLFTISNAMINKILLKKMNNGNNEKRPSQCKVENEYMNAIHSQNCVVDQIN